MSAKLMGYGFAASKHFLCGLATFPLQISLRGSSKGSENRVQEVSEITQGLKAIA